jgi:iron complex transport system ATP-binding protein
MTLAARDITVEADGRDIVRGASLEVGAGELVGLIGPNGAGKSTLLKAILGLRPRRSGAVVLDGRPFDSIPPRERARWVAYLAQEGRVEWRLSARDVVALGRRPHQPSFGGPTPSCRPAVARALAAVEATDIADRPVAVLSGGERARVLLARALAVEAPLLLADEPTASLDPYHQLHVMEILKAEAARGAGVLVVLHDLALAARFMDRLVVMSEGAVVAAGTPDEVLDDATLGAVYRIAAVRGREAGGAWVMPWTRRGSA